MACRQRGKLDAPADEEWVGADEERVGPLAPKRCEGCIDLAAGAGVEDPDLQPDSAAAVSALLHVPTPHAQDWLD